jgi:hypothetical protein
VFIGQVWANHHVMFDHIRTADRIVLVLNTVLLMIVAFPDGVEHQRRHVERRTRLLSEALGPAGATATSRRFQLPLAWLATGALLGAVLPVLGVAVIVAFDAFYWFPIRGESPAPRSVPG